MTFDISKNGNVYAHQGSLTTFGLWLIHILSSMTTLIAYNEHSKGHEHHKMSH